MPSPRIFLRDHQSLQIALPIDPALTACMHHALLTTQGWVLARDFARGDGEAGDELPLEAPLRLGQEVALDLGEDGAVTPLPLGSRQAVRATVSRTRVARLSEVSDKEAMAAGIEVRQDADGPPYSHPGSPARFASARLAFQAWFARRHGAELAGSDPWLWLIELQDAAMSQPATP